jgi:hypothetical protein
MKNSSFTELQQLYSSGGHNQSLYFQSVDFLGKIKGLVGFEN